MSKLKVTIFKSLLLCIPDMFPKRYSKDERQYTSETVKEAVSAVNQKRLNVSKAAKEFNIPRKTLDDHVKGKVRNKKPVPNAQLTVEENNALVDYMKYMANRGFPMTRNIVRQFVISVVRESGRETRFNLDKGPSDKWFRKFSGTDRERSRAARQRTP